jgi:hypothetical protein
LLRWRAVGSRRLRVGLTLPPHLLILCCGGRFGCGRGGRLLLLRLFGRNDSGLDPVGDRGRDAGAGGRGDARRERGERHQHARGMVGTPLVLPQLQ